SIKYNGEIKPRPFDKIQEQQQRRRPPSTANCQINDWLVYPGAAAHRRIGSFSGSRLLLGILRSRNILNVDRHLCSYTWDFWIRGRGRTGAPTDGQGQQQTHKRIPLRGPIVSTKFLAAPSPALW